MIQHLTFQALFGCFVALLSVHWFADFVCQTHWQATNKSKSLEALAQHVMVYTIILTAVATLLFGVWGLVFAYANGLCHFATDFCTSRWSSKLWAKQDMHNFFAVIGFDQLIHQITLAVLLWAFFGVHV